MGWLSFWQFQVYVKFGCSLGPCMLGTDFRFRFFGLCFCSVLFLFGVGDKHALVLHDILLLFCNIQFFKIFWLLTTAEDNERTPDSLSLTHEFVCIFLKVGFSSVFVLSFSKSCLVQVIYVIFFLGFALAFPCWGFWSKITIFFYSLRPWVQGLSFRFSDFALVCFCSVRESHQARLLHVEFWWCSVVFTFFFIFFRFWRQRRMWSAFVQFFFY